ncbi:MAG: hypothetical protein HW397_311, partial [Dehalococcoidia bacterium]|nr:hypothetical protein [Dehalococcoidia bacterium]
ITCEAPYVAKHQFMEHTPAKSNGQILLSGVSEDLRWRI